MHPRPLVALISLFSLLSFVACLTQSPEVAKQHLWWSGFGPVLPHETLPADCALCHEENDWQGMREDFVLEQEGETGVTLNGAHGAAACLRCHNDRGPVAEFARQGCGGCHEDIHLGQLGPSCSDCHQETTWQPFGMVERHNETRFPLVGVHTTTACYRCHPGAEVGKFVPTDTECVTCHRNDLARTADPATGAPNHFGLGWIDRCDRCHLPRTWKQAEINL